MLNELSFGIKGHDSVIFQVKTQPAGRSEQVPAKPQYSLFFSFIPAHILNQMHINVVALICKADEALDDRRLSQ
jgi:hypothetical protein